MNIKNLTQGQTIKNYKQLCNILDIKPSTGNSKIGQLKDLERYIKYHKDGNKFVVDEIHNIPLDKQDNRGAEAIYKDHIKVIILYLLLQHDINQKEKYWRLNTYMQQQEENYKYNCNNRFIISKSRLMNYCGMYGEFYFKYINKRHELSEKLKVKKLYIHDAYTYDFKANSSILDRALKQLESERIILVNNTYIYNLSEDDENYIADAGIIDMFLRAENAILKELNIKNIGIVYLCRKEQEFKRKVIDYLNKQIDEDNNYFIDDYILDYNRVLDIHYIDNILLETLQEQLKNNIDINKQELKNKILTSIENTLRKVNEKSKYIPDKKGYDYLRANDNYINIVMEIIKIITSDEYNSLDQLQPIVIKKPKGLIKSKSINNFIDDPEEIDWNAFYDIEESCPF